MEMDAEGDVGGILILISSDFSPYWSDVSDPASDSVHHMFVLNGGGGVLNRFLHQLHLLDPVLHQLKLNIQRVQHKPVVRITYCHLTDIVQ